ncbi:unnamed protein product [[Candida] boidinii]|nr:unnamed protein product [[Candida] boidinii]
MDVQLTEDQLLRGDLEERKRSKKKTINVNDYSSDSDEDDDEGVKDYELGPNGNNKNASKLKSGDDIDDDDMFASGSDDEVPVGADKESKQAVKKTTKDGIKLMDMDEFEKSLNSKEEDKLQTVNLSSNTGEAADLFDEKDTESEIRDKYKDPEYRRKESEYYNNPEDFDIYVGDRLKFKKKEPKIESFDLKKEMKRGDFDESGNYILKKRGKNSEDESGEDDDDDDDYDDDNDDEDDDDIATNKSRSKEAWLLNVSQKDIEKAKQVERDRTERQKQKYILERSKLRDFPTEKILFDLIKLLQIAETPLEALQRLNEIIMKEKKDAKRQKRLHRNRVTENNDRTGLQGDADAIYAKSLFDITKQTINQISENCDMLAKRNFTKVYETSREELMRDYRRLYGKDFAVVDDEDTKSKRKYDKVASDGDASDVEEFSLTKESGPMEPIPASDKSHIQWEYYWGEDPDTIYGPFTTDEMAAWSDSYFLEQEVFVRRVGTDDTFSNIRDVTL